MKTLKRFAFVLLSCVIALMLADAASAKPQKNKQPSPPPRTSPSFSALDKNNDGRLSLEEFNAGFPNLANPEEKFKSLDTNGDGFVGMDEYKAGYPDPIPLKKVVKNVKKGQKVKPKVDPAKRFAKLDTNGDGKLSLDEYKAGHPKDSKAAKRFKTIDADGDGFLSLDEFIAGQTDKPKKQKKN
jgi:Ca2+-binding EF-hand superfamily protein